MVLLEVLKEEILPMIPDLVLVAVHHHRLLRLAFLQVAPGAAIHLLLGADFRMGADFQTGRAPRDMNLARRSLHMQCLGNCLP